MLMCGLMGWGCYINIGAVVETELYKLTCVTHIFKLFRGTLLFPMPLPFTPWPRVFLKLTFWPFLLNIVFARRWINLCGSKAARPIVFTANWKRSWSVSLYCRSYWATNHLARRNKKSSTDRIKKMYRSDLLYWWANLQKSWKFSRRHRQVIPINWISLRDKKEKGGGETRSSSTFSRWKSRWIWQASTCE